MTPRRPWSNLEKFVVVALLLAAIVGVFLLRFPAHPLLGYNHHVEFRPHRSHFLPSCALVDEVFHPAALVSFGTLLCLSHIEHSAKIFAPVEVSSLISNLRC